MVISGPYFFEGGIHNRLRCAHVRGHARGQGGRARAGVRGQARGQGPGARSQGPGARDKGQGPNLPGARARGHGLSQPRPLTSALSEDKWGGRRPWLYYVKSVDADDVIHKSPSGKCCLICFNVFRALGSHAKQVSYIGNSATSHPNSHYKTAPKQSL